MKRIENKKLKEKAKKKNYRATIWLADVEKFYEVYAYNLGYLRKNGPPRRNRPAIVVDKQIKNYRVFFLSTSGKGYNFITSKCAYQYCTKGFLWESESRIFIRFAKNRRYRFMFTLKEEDLEELMEFCGLCSEEYIKNVVYRKKKKCLMRF